MAAMLLPLIVALAFLSSRCSSSDPDPLQDFCVADLNGAISVNGFPCKPMPEVKPSEFFYDGLTKEGNTSNPFGATVTAANVLAFPALNTLGISMNRVDFAPGGLNPPHSHPRASEAGLVIMGELLVGFVTTDNVFRSKVLKPGEMFVIPRGVVHFQLNVGKGKAMTVTSFNSQMPGAVILPLNLFASQPSLPYDVLTKAFQVDQKVINEIKFKFA
ncbi:hypothetical protein Sjap_015914 [Stephania japonica]|uniref:Germin-like protein n=1 Tax=Stephania japonica TaxID=461633 RepID=A0AAP0IKB0_9MAGN